MGLLIIVYIVCHFLVHIWKLVISILPFYFLISNSKAIKIEVIGFHNT